MACGNLTDPSDHPVRFLVIWSITALLAVSMLFYGIVRFLCCAHVWFGECGDVRQRLPRPCG